MEEDEQLRDRSSLSISGMQPAKPRNSASCFVHGHFLDEQLSGKHPPESAAEHVHYKIDKDSHGQDAGTTSRLLTKKQLSDMAFSIRELSKRLGRFRLKLDIRNVFLLTKAYDETLIGLAREVAAWLLSKESDGNYTVWVDVFAFFTRALIDTVLQLRREYTRKQEEVRRARAFGTGRIIQRSIKILDK